MTTMMTFAGEMARSFPNCVICYSKVNVDSVQNGEDEDESNETGRILEAQLNVIFILRNIFELEEKQLELYLQKWGTPGGNWLILCGSCEDDVRNLRKIFLKLHDIKREFERKKFVIQNRVQISEEEKELSKKISGIERISFECRNSVSLSPNRKSSPKIDNPFQEGDQRATELALQIKAEEKDETVYIGPDNDDDSERLDGGNNISFHNETQRPIIVQDQSLLQLQPTIQILPSSDGGPGPLLLYQVVVPYIIPQPQPQQPLPISIITPTPTTTTPKPSSSGRYRTIFKKPGPEPEPDHIIPQPQPQPLQIAIITPTPTPSTTDGYRTILKKPGAEPESDHHEPEIQILAIKSLRKKTSDCNSKVSIGHDDDDDVKPEKLESFQTSSTKRSFSPIPSSSHKILSSSKFIHCPVCESSFLKKKSLIPFSQHFQECVISASFSGTGTSSLQCSLCNSWSTCSSSNVNVVRLFMEHVVLCRDGHPLAKPIIPWRHSLMKCNLCQDSKSCYLPFSDYAQHIHQYHRHKYGCTRCPYRNRENSNISREHWNRDHKNFLDITPMNQRYEMSLEPPLLPHIPWWCPRFECRQEFPDEASRDSHFLNCQGEGIFVKKVECLLCDRVYFSEEELLMHRVCTHEYLQPRDFSCSECNIKFERSRLLVSHQRKVHKMRLVSCLKCGAEFDERAKLNIHFRLEHGTEKDRFTCNICQEAFGYRHHLRYHIEGTHDERQCLECGEVCQDQESFASHMTSEHPEISSSSATYCCTFKFCEKVFQSFQGLNMHFAKRHSSFSRKNPFTCSFCGRQFLRQFDFRKHTKTCRVPNLKCKRCKLRFTKVELLTEHNLSIHKRKPPVSVKISPKKSPSTSKQIVKRKVPKAPFDFSKVTLSEDKSSGSCNACGKHFESVGNLIVHVRYIHEKAVAQTCTECGASFNRLSILKLHMIQRHGVEAEYKCKTCGKAYLSESGLQSHILTSGHTDGDIVDSSIPLKSVPCTWEGCGKILKNFDLMKHHVRNFHERRYDQKCSLCDKMVNRKCLKDHMANSHGIGIENRKQTDEKDGPFPCTWDGCGKVFKTSSRMKIHVSQVHRRIHEQICTVCGRKSSNMDQLRIHMARQHPEQVVDPSQFVQQCEICGKNFYSRGSLRVHVRAVHEKKTVVECDICGKSVSSGKVLLVHKARVHKIGNLKCDKEGCNEVFAIQSHLESHLKYDHEGIQRPPRKKSNKATKVLHHCQFCGKGFTDKSALRIHKEAKHLNKDSRPFPCPLPECGRSFPIKGYVREHLKNCHGIIQGLRGGQFKTVTKGDEIIEICDKCGTRFEKGVHLKMHAKYCQDKEFPEMCTLCGKGFQTELTLLRHKAVGHAVGGNKCKKNGCSKVFVEKKNLEEHEKLMHQLVKCKLCGEECEGRRNFILHEKTAHPEKYYIPKPFRCPFPGCDKAHATKSSSTRHMRRDHHQ